MYLFALEIVIPYYEAGSVQGNVNNLIRAHFLWIHAQLWYKHMGARNEV